MEGRVEYLTSLPSELDASDISNLDLQSILISLCQMTHRLTCGSYPRVVSQSACNSQTNSLIFKKKKKSVRNKLSKASVTKAYI